MRFLYGVLAMGVWIPLVLYLNYSGNMGFTNRDMLVTLAIVVAGAMAGGD